MKALIKIIALTGLLISTSFAQDNLSKTFRGINVNDFNNKGENPLKNPERGFITQGIWSALKLENSTSNSSNNLDTKQLNEFVEAFAEDSITIAEIYLYLNNFDNNMKADFNHNISKEQLNQLSADFKKLDSFGLKFSVGTLLYHNINIGDFTSRDDAKYKQYKNWMQDVANFYKENEALIANVYPGMMDLWGEHFSLLPYSFNFSDYWTRKELVFQDQIDILQNTVPGKKIIARTPRSWTIRRYVQKNNSQLMYCPTCIISDVESNPEKEMGYFDAFFQADWNDYWGIGDWKQEPTLPQANSLVGLPFAEYTNFGTARRLRDKMWVHGEFPGFDNKYSASGALQSWSLNGLINLSDAELALKDSISRGQKADGFLSALKLRYLGYTTFDRFNSSEYQAQRDHEIYNNGFQPAMMHWKDAQLSKSQLVQYGMPVSDNYFVDGNGKEITRSAFDYIRDHLGYRIELQNLDVKKVSNTEKEVSINLINRGFAAPQYNRNVYVVILDSNGNPVPGKTFKVDTDITTWVPDALANANSDYSNGNDYPHSGGNIEEASRKAAYNGIPVGPTNWHKSPIGYQYAPYTYTIKTKVNFKDLANGEYQIGLWMPDNNAQLKNNADYSIKVANGNVTFNYKNGVNVLTKIQYNSGVPASNYSYSIAYNAPKNVNITTKNTTGTKFEVKLKEVNGNLTETLRVNPVNNVISFDLSEKWMHVSNIQLEVTNENNESKTTQFKMDNGYATDGEFVYGEDFIDFSINSNTRMMKLDFQSGKSQEYNVVVVTVSGKVVEKTTVKITNESRIENIRLGNLPIAQNEVLLVKVSAPDGTEVQKSKIKFN